MFEKKTVGDFSSLSFVFAFYLSSCLQIEAILTKYCLQRSKTPYHCKVIFCERKQFFKLLMGVFTHLWFKSWTWIRSCCWLYLLFLSTDCIYRLLVEHFFEMLEIFSIFHKTRGTSIQQKTNLEYLLTMPKIVSKCLSTGTHSKDCTTKVYQFSVGVCTSMGI